MDTKKLRQKILDLAIRGKLVPQDPNDEPASVLLQRIKAEKERLIKEGKIKRSKKSASDTSHYENVCPNGWVCVNLGELCSIFSTGPFGSMVHKSDYVGKDGVPLVNPINISSGMVSEQSLMMVSEEKATELRRYKLNKNDIVIARRGDLSKCAVITEIEEGWLCGTGSFFLHIPFVEPRYFQLFYLSDYVQTELDKRCVGATMSNLNQDVLGNIPFMLPPYAEQKRIMNEVKRWFSLIDTLEENGKDLFQIIDKTKSKVLDLAIHGQLVPQSLDDEPAFELLKRINPDIEIPCDNPHYPFDIPKSWCWVYGSQVFAPMQSCTPNGETFKYIDIDTIDNKNNSILSAKILPTKDAPSRASRFTMKDDTLFSMVRPYLRNIAMVKEDDCIASTGFYVCRSNGSLLAKYCFYMMLSSYVVDGLNFFMKGDNSPSINRSHIESFIYPLPPLAEQKRIVSEIDRYFNALDRIKESLTA